MRYASIYSTGTVLRRAGHVLVYGYFLVFFIIFILLMILYIYLFVLKLQHIYVDWALLVSLMLFFS